MNIHCPSYRHLRTGTALTADKVMRKIVFIILMKADISIYTEKTLNIWKRKCCGKGYNVDNNADNRMIYTLQFADDQVMMAQSEEDLEYMCRKLQEEYSKWGLTMNIVKTKYMSLGTDTNYLEVDNDIITGCTEYKYLGSIFTKVGTDTRNIRHWVTQARKIIGALNEIWWSMDINKPKKYDL
jgi:hypothetical protein